MAKRRKHHGGVLSPIDALYFAVHDYPHGGLQVVAARLKISDDVLRKKIDPDYATHNPQFAESMHILRITKDERLIDSINRTVGAVWNFESDTPQHPGELDLLKTSSALMAKAVAVITELETALEDGQIDPVERARIDQALLNLAKQMKSVDATAAQFHTEDC